MTYSAMARFQDALSDRPRDHVPLFPFVGNWALANFSNSPLSKVFSDAVSIVEAEIRAYESIEADPLFIPGGALFIPEAFGCNLRFAETGPLIGPLPLTFSNLKDVDRLHLPDPTRQGRLPVILETVERLHEYSKGDLPLSAGFEGPFSATGRMIEAEPLMRMTYRNRPVLEALLDKVTGFLIDFGRAVVERGVSILFIPEPTASASMISPAMFREIVLPRLQRFFSEVNVPCILHICGETTPILELMAETGASVLSLDQCMNLSDSRKRLPKAVIGGNVDPINSLLLGTKEQVVDDTLNCLRSAGTTRFVLMTGCDTPRNAPVENLKAMIETGRNYGLG